ncbi:MAG: hypothetical protein H6827_09695 [Planctomycetes bacterium]|nr:hypothetical protein [Planctomycetota bacterium]
MKEGTELHGGEQAYRSVLATHHLKLLRVPAEILEAQRVEGMYHIRINPYLAVILPPLHILREALQTASAHDAPFLHDEIALVELATQRLQSTQLPSLE